MATQIKSYDDKLTFGKYAGQSVSEILDKDIDYILWLLEKNIITMDKDMIDALEWDNRIESEELKQIYFD